MWVCVSACALFVFLFWLFLIPHESTNKNTSSLNFKDIKKGVSERIDKSGLKNITGEIKKATENISKPDIEDEIKENKVPRLPLEIE